MKYMCCIHRFWVEHKELTSSSMGLVYCRAAISCSISAWVFFFMSTFCSTFRSFKSPPGGIMGTLFSAQACREESTVYTYYAAHRITFLFKEERIHRWHCSAAFTRCGGVTCWNCAGIGLAYGTFFCGTFLASLPMTSSMPQSRPGMDISSGAASLPGDNSHTWVTPDTIQDLLTSMKKLNVILDQVSVKRYEQWACHWP